MITMQPNHRKNLLPYYVKGLANGKFTLTHTSGVPDYFDESVMDEYEELWIDFPNYKIRYNNDLFPLFINKPMLYPKGEKFQYNNSGYVLLASIIEKISGMYFDEYLQKNIFKPCKNYIDFLLLT